MQNRTHTPNTSARVLAILLATSTLVACEKEDTKTRPALPHPTESADADSPSKATTPPKPKGEDATDTPPPSPPTAVEEVTELPYKNKAPAGFEMPGKIVAALGWRDKYGENALVFSETLTTAGSARTLLLQARHARDMGGSWEEVRSFKELVKNCKEDDVLALVATDSWTITDIDHDGVGEVTFAYSAGCRTGEETSLKHKVLMIEDGEKYALRGTTEVLDGPVATDAAGNFFFNSKGGKFKPDFDKAPTGFQAHAEKVWSASASELPEEARGADDPAAATDATDLTGEYIYTHQVEDMNGDAESVTNCLDLKAAGDDLSFVFSLEFPAEQSCGMKGVAKSSGDSSWTYKGSAKDDDADCELKLSVKGEQISLLDVGDNCRKMWCGARASINGESFMKDQRAKSTGTCTM